MGHSRTFRRVAAAVLVTMLVPIGLADPAAAAAPTASFDWSMPARFGPDRNTDGIIDYVDGAHDQAPTGYDATPAGWHVDLDACASAVTGAATYAWHVVDQPNPATPCSDRPRRGGGPDRPSTHGRGRVRARAPGSAALQREPVS